MKWSTQHTTICNTYPPHKKKENTPVSNAVLCKIQWKRFQVEASQCSKRGKWSATSNTFTHFDLPESSWQRTKKWKNCRHVMRIVFYEKRKNTMELNLLQIHVKHYALRVYSVRWAFGYKWETNLKVWVFFLPCWFCRRSVHKWTQSSCPHLTLSPPAGLPSSAPILPSSFLISSCFFFFSLVHWAVSSVNL